MITCSSAPAFSLAHIASPAAEGSPRRQRRNVQGRARLPHGSGPRSAGVRTSNSARSCDTSTKRGVVLQRDLAAPRAAGAACGRLAHRAIELFNDARPESIPVSAMSCPGRQRRPGRCPNPPGCRSRSVPRPRPAPGHRRTTGHETVVTGRTRAGEMARHLGNRRPGDHNFAVGNPRNLQITSCASGRANASTRSASPAGRNRAMRFVATSCATGRHYRPREYRRVGGSICAAARASADRRSPCRPISVRR